MEDILNGGFFKGKKTYITSAVGIVTAIGAYLVGEMALSELIQTVFPLLSIIFVRSSIETTSATTDVATESE